jgi:hypothetical protein
MTDERTLLPVEKLTVKISSTTEKVITIDQSSPEWSWLQNHPQSQWQQLLDDSVNDTGGQLEMMIDDVPVDVAYREVEIIGPSDFLPSKSNQPDPWGLS